MTSRAKCVAAEDGRSLQVLGSEMTIKIDARETDGAYEAVLVDCGPGGDVIAHRHPWGEAYVVLDGTIEVQIGRRLHAAGPGALLNIPPRALHGFRVTSERARFLHISIGPGAVAAFDDFARHVPGEPTIDDLPAVLSVNARHGIELVLPTTV
jgi:quercetin dioxygenase-like cupin family protein